MAGRSSPRCVRRERHQCVLVTCVEPEHHRSEHETRAVARQRRSSRRAGGRARGGPALWGFGRRLAELAHHQGGEPSDIPPGKRMAPAAARRRARASAEGAPRPRPTIRRLIGRQIDELKWRIESLSRDDSPPPPFRRRLGRRRRNPQRAPRRRHRADRPPARSPQPQQAHGASRYRRQRRRRARRDHRPAACAGRRIHRSRSCSMLRPPIRGRRRDTQNVGRRKAAPGDRRPDQDAAGLDAASTVSPPA